MTETIDEKSRLKIQHNIFEIIKILKELKSKVDKKSDLSKYIPTGSGIVIYDDGLVNITLQIYI